MTKRIILVCLGFLWVMTAGCQGLLDPQAAKDRDLGQVVEDNMKTSNEFMGHIESFDLESPGVYRAVTTGLNTVQDVGRFAYNAMVVLDERNNSLVKSGRSDFTIIGEQNGTDIFRVTIAAGGRPQVTLLGPYEGEEWSPSR
jgi:hypothetical protein